jgi:hypothetical protein
MYPDDKVRVKLSWGRFQWGILMKTLMNYTIQWHEGKFLTSWVTVSFSKGSAFCGMTWFTALGEKQQEHCVVIWRNVACITETACQVHE